LWFLKKKKEITEFDAVAFIGYIKLNLDQISVEYKRRKAYTYLDTSGEKVYTHWVKICDLINHSPFHGITPSFDKNRLSSQYGSKGHIFSSNVKLLIDETQAFLNYLTSDSRILEDVLIWNNLHPELKALVHQKFKDGHYADAVETAFKSINEKVKLVYFKARKEELDGTKLMHAVFSLNNPIYILDDLSTESGRNIQSGYHKMFAGSMEAIRNPKAHANLKISPQRCIHQLFVASLLLYKIDEGKPI